MAYSLHSAYRLTRVEADLGFVECAIIIQHEESLQQISAAAKGKADVQLSAYELSKEMVMK